MSDLNPKVSIVIPVYNGANYLKEAIDSALSQTYSNIEVIVVNDGSNDDGATKNIAESFGDKIRYFEKDNGGVSSALNYGINKMSGEYFSWLSHDDLYYPSKIEEQIEILKKSNSIGDSKVVVYSDYEFISDSGTVKKKTFPAYTMDGIYYNLIIKKFLNGCALLIHKDAFHKEVGFFDEALKTVQDYKLWFSMLMQGFLFKKVEKVLVKSRMHGNQDSIGKEALHVKEKDALYSWVLTATDAGEYCGAKGKKGYRYLRTAIKLILEGEKQSARIAIKKAKMMKPNAIKKMIISFVYLLFSNMITIKYMYSKVKRKVYYKA